MASDGYRRGYVSFAHFLLYLLTETLRGGGGGGGGGSNKHCLLPFFIFDWIFFIFAGNNKNYIVLDEFEIQPDQTMDCGMSCP